MKTLLTAFCCVLALAALFSTAALRRVADVAIDYEDRNVQLLAEVADLRERLCRQDAVVAGLEAEVRRLTFEEAGDAR